MESMDKNCETAFTPGPWSVNPNRMSDVIGPDCRTIALCYGAGNEAPANAAFIVQACNAYGSTDASNADRNFENAREAWNLVWKREAELSKLKASTDALRSALAKLADAVDAERRTYEDHRRLFDPEVPIPADVVVKRTGDAFDAAYANTNEAVKEAHAALSGSPEKESV